MSPEELKLLKDIAESLNGIYIQLVTMNEEGITVFGGHTMEEN